MIEISKTRRKYLKPKMPRYCACKKPIPQSELSIKCKYCGKQIDFRRKLDPKFYQLVESEFVI